MRAAVRLLAAVLLSAGTILDHATRAEDDESPGYWN